MKREEWAYWNTLSVAELADASFDDALFTERLWENWRLLLLEENNLFVQSNGIIPLRSLVLAAAITEGAISSLGQARAVLHRYME